MFRFASLKNDSGNRVKYVEIGVEGHCSNRSER